MPENKENQLKISRPQQTLMLATIFGGLATGFIAFWSTLSLVYPALIGAIGSAVVWTIAKQRGESYFAMMTALTFFVTALVGMGVGVGSSFGSGVPIMGP